MASVNDKPPTSTGTPQPGSDSSLREWFWTIIIRLLPLAAAFGAYLLSGISQTPANPDLQGIQNLLRFALALITGMVTYVAVTELTLRRLPSRVASQVAVLREELSAVSTQMNALNGVVAEQLRTLTNLREFETFYDQDDALVKARALQSSASKSVQAMWTLVPYDEALTEYFAETLAAGIYTSRIVSTHAVSAEHLLDHIDRSWEYLAAGTYDLHLVRECNYEALVVDHGTAGMFFYSSKGFGSCFMSSTSAGFVQVVEGLIHGLKRPDWQLPIEANSPKDLDTIRDWVDAFYSNHHGKQ